MRESYSDQIFINKIFTGECLTGEDMSPSSEVKQQPKLLDKHKLALLRGESKKGFSLMQHAVIQQDNI